MDFGFSPLDPKIIASFTGDGAVKLMERSLADVRLTVPPEESVSRMVRKKSQCRKKIFKRMVVFWELNYKKTAAKHIRRAAVRQNNFYVIRA